MMRWQVHHIARSAAPVFPLHFNYILCTNNKTELIIKGWVSNFNTADFLSSFLQARLKINLVNLHYVPSDRHGWVSIHRNFRHLSQVPVFKAKVTLDSLWEAQIPNAGVLINAGRQLLSKLSSIWLIYTNAPAEQQRKRHVIHLKFRLGCEAAWKKAEKSHWFL